MAKAADLGRVAYFKDLAPGAYGGGAYDSAAWSCPLLYVGWIEGGHPYEQGEVPDWVVPRIHELRYYARSQTGFSFRHGS